MDNIIIRPAVPTDVPGLAMLNEIFNEAGTTEETIRESLATNDREQVFVAQSQGQLVGFICVQVFKSMCYTVNYAEITELFVMEEHRKTGIGAKLMAYAQEAVKTEGVKGYQLFTGGDNVIAQRFYEGLGYKGTDEIMYRKRL